MSRRTTAQVVFDGVDISADIENYLVSLSYTDNEEGEADDLQITLQDRDGDWVGSWLEQTVNADTGSTTTETAGTTQTQTNGSQYSVTAQSGLNLRTGPSTDYARVTAVPYGTVLTVTGTSGNWSIVSYNGQTVYAYSQYLTPATSSGTVGDPASYPTLRYGSNGEYVRIMQTALIAKGQSLPKYGIDGLFRSETEAAVRAFQSANGLTVDGICGPKTWAKLLGTDSTADSSTATKKGFLIRATINREDWNDDYSDSLDCGQFELDTIDASGPPSTVTIKATALPYTAQIRQTKKSRAWEAYTLQGIAQEMASNAGMTCMYESSYNPTYAHIEQYEESDIVFLTRLSHDAGISVKCSNNILILFDQSTYEKLGSVMTISKNDTACYEKYKLSTSEADTQYDSCRVRYTDPATGQVIEAIAKVEDYDEEGTNNQQLEYWAKVTSIGEAQTLAEKRLRYHNKFSRQASFTLPGNPDLVAGVCVDLEDFGLWNGKYIIEQAKHTLSSGYTTQISLRNVLEGY